MSVPPPSQPQRLWPVGRFEMPVSVCCLPGLIEALMPPLLMRAMLQLAQALESGCFRLVWTVASATKLPVEKL